MKIYLASGFTIMNIEGREREMLEKFGIWNRLISYYDTVLGNDIFQVIRLKKEVQDENILRRKHNRTHRLFSYYYHGTGKEFFGEFEYRIKEKNEKI